MHSIAKGQSGSARSTSVNVGTDGLFSCLPKANKEIEDPAAARQLAIAGSPGDKIRFFRDRVVFTPAYRSAFDTITFLMDQAEEVKEPGGLMILGEGGCGKSFLADQLRKRYVPDESLYWLEVPLITVQLEGSPDEKDFMMNLLAQTGEIVSRTEFTATELEDKVIGAFNRVGCRGLYIDEAQRLDTITKNRRQADRKMGPIGERLKRIYGATKTTIILAGTPSLEELVCSDSQYATRWSASVRLYPFEFGSEFMGVLKALALAVPLADATDFSSQTVARAIWESCGGYFRVLKNFLTNALKIACQENASSIRVAHLRAAYSVTGNFAKTNPFNGISE